MGRKRGDLPPLPAGEQPVIERMSAGPVVADTFAGRIHVEWDNSATVTPLGQLPVFIEFVKQGSLFDSCVADCPLHYRRPNAPNKRDVLGTVLLSVLAGHWRYAHMTTLRCDPVNPPLLGMTQVVSEDAVRRGFDKIEEQAGLDWLQRHLDYTTRLVSHPIVRTHAWTGQKSLFVTAGECVGIEGLPSDEGIALIEELHAHCLQAEFQY